MQNNRLQTTESTFELIEVLRRKGEVSLQEITNHVEMSKPTVHCHLNTLKNIGYVRKNNHRYSLSLQFLSLGHDILNLLAPISVLKEHAELIVEESGFNSSISIAEEYYGYTIYNTDGKFTNSAFQSTGKAFLLHNMAAGKAMLSLLEPDELDMYFEYCRTNDKLNTLSESAAINEIEQIREIKISENIDQGILAKAVAFPINDRIYSVSAHAPKNEETTRRFNDEIEQILSEIRTEHEE
jgi:DNA-binding IclR family transcriptional regulator